MDTHCFLVSFSFVVAGVISVSAVEQGYQQSSRHSNTRISDYGLRGHQRYAPRSPYATAYTGYTRGYYNPRNVMLAALVPVELQAYQNTLYGSSPTDFSPADAKFISGKRYEKNPFMYHKAKHLFQSGNRAILPLSLYQLNPDVGLYRQGTYQYGGNMRTNSVNDKRGYRKPFENLEDPPTNVPLRGSNGSKRYTGSYFNGGGALHSKIGYGSRARRADLPRDGYYSAESDLGFRRNDYPPQHVSLYGYTPKQAVGWSVKLYTHEQACRRLGLYLRDPDDRCSYYRCMYGDQPMKRDGSVWVVARRMSCPPGTSVPYNYSGGQAAPCTVSDNFCLHKVHL